MSLFCFSLLVFWLASLWFLRPARIYRRVRIGVHEYLLEFYLRIAIRLFFYFSLLTFSYPFVVPFWRLFLCFCFLIFSVLYLIHLNAWKHEALRPVLVVFSRRALSAKE